MELFRLFGSILIDNKDALEKMDSLDKKVARAGDNLVKFGGGVTKVGSTLTKFVTGPALLMSGALFTLVGKTAEWGDRIQDLSAITGMSTGEIQRWQYVAKRAGVEVEAVTRATEGLVRRMAQLESEGGRATEQLGKLGLSYEDLKKMSPDEMMDTLIQRLAEMDDVVERNAIGAQLFGGAWKDIAPILSMGADGIDEAKKKAEELGLILDEEGLIALQKFREAVVDLKATFSALVNYIASKVAPVFTDTIFPIINDKVVPVVKLAADKVGALLDAFNNLDQGTKDTIFKLLGALVGAGPALMILGKAITLIGTIVGAISGPVAIAVGVIAALVAGIVAAWNSSEEFRNKVMEIWDKVKELFSKVKETVLESMGGAEGAFESFQETVTPVLDTVLDAVMGFVDLVMVLWDEYGEEIMAVTQAVWGMVSGIIEGAFKIIGGLLDFFVGLFTGDWEKMKEGLLKIWQGLWGLVEDVIMGAWEILKTIGIKIWEGFKENFTKSRDIAVELTEQLRDWVTGKLDELWSYLTDLPSKAYTWGKDILNKLWDGMKAIYQRLKTWFNNNVKGLLDKLNPFTKASPSLVEMVWRGAEEIAKAYASIKIPDFDIKTAMMAPMEPAIVPGITPGHVDRSDHSSRQITFAPVFNSPERQSHSEQLREFKKWTQEVAFQGELE